MEHGLTLVRSYFISHSNDSTSLSEYILWTDPYLSIVRVRKSIIIFNSVVIDLYQSQSCTIYTSYTTCSGTVEPILLEQARQVLQRHKHLSQSVVLA